MSLCNESPHCKQQGIYNLFWNTKATTSGWELYPFRLKTPINHVKCKTFINFIILILLASFAPLRFKYISSPPKVVKKLKRKRTDFLEVWLSEKSVGGVG